MVILSGALLITSASLFFSPTMRRVQAVMLVATVVAVSVILLAYRTPR